MTAPNIERSSPIQILGSIESLRGGKQKSSMRPSMLYEFFGHHVPELKAPTLKARTVMIEGKETWLDPNLVCAGTIISSTVNNPVYSFMQCAIYLADELWKKALNMNRMSFPGPLSIHEAVNGCPRLGIKSLVLDSAAGAEFPGLKSEWVYGNIGNLVLHEEVLDAIDYILSEIDNDRVPYQLCKWALKGNEVIKSSKDDIGKVRVFSVVSMAVQVIGKMYISPAAAWSREHRDVFPCKLGMNAASPEWDLYAQRLRRFVTEGKAKQVNVFSEDYPTMDKLMDQVSTSYAVVERWQQRAGYSERDRKRTLGLAQMSQQQAFVSEGALGVSKIAHASGDTETGFINSKYDATQQVWVFYKALSEVKHLDIEVDLPLMFADVPFFDHVELGDLGDDNIKTMSDFAIQFYTDERSARVWNSVGWKMSDAADKKQSPKMRHSLEETSFLKRGFRLDPVLGYVAPLDINSLWKALCWTSPSELSDYDRSVALLQESQRVAFLHGKEKFIEIQEELKRASCKVRFKMFIYEDLEKEYLLCAQEQRPFMESFV